MASNFAPRNADPTLPSLDEIREGAESVYKLMQPTPQYCWPLLGRRLGTEVWMKHENQTPTGSFKARTAIVYAEKMRKREPGVRGLISATRGNHGQSVALAAQRMGLPCIIVVPEGNSVEKNAAMESQGAQLIINGRDYQSSREHAAELAAEKQYHFVPPYHRDIVCGVASYWLELFSNVQNIDVAYVAIGMGSGISAGAAVRNALGLRTRLVGVVSEKAPAYMLSWEAGRSIEAETTSRIADGISCRKVDDEPLSIVRAHVDHLVTVSDDEVEAAMRAIFSDTHNVVEGAGAAGLAGAIKEKDLLKGKRVAVIATGANIDRPLFAKVIGAA